MKPNTFAMRKHIPHDLIISILSNLPLKSLKRFYCACKSWALLFEHPHFMNMFRNNFISRWHSYYDDSCLFLKHDVGDVLYLLSGENKIKFDWPPLHDKIFVNTPILILGSSVNGILCLYTYKNDYNKIVLWNPTTQEFKFIPSALYEYNPFELRFPLLYGFGYDHVTDDYKVIQYNRFYKHFTWEMYSLRSNSWKKIPALDHVGTVLNNYPTGMDVHLNGVCHWMDEISRRLDKAPTETEITAYLVSFDLTNEVVLTTPLPIKKCEARPVCHGPPCFLQTHLTVLNGSIAFISNCEDATTTFHISVLGQLGVQESWTKLFIIGPLPGLEHLPIGIGRKGDVLFKIDDKLAWFDLSTQMIMEVGVREESILAIVVGSIEPSTIRLLSDHLQMFSYANLMLEMFNPRHEGVY
ncbi:F-box/kelch-repeat protein, partial [Mucuna pruriens]